MYQRARISSGGGESVCKVYHLSCDVNNNYFYITHGNDTPITWAYNAANGNKLDDDLLTINKSSNTYTLTFKASCTVYYQNGLTAAKTTGQTLSGTTSAVFPAVVVFD